MPFENFTNLIEWQEMKRFLLLLTAALSACVPLPPEDAASGAPLRVPLEREYPGLDPGGKEQVSLHFRVFAYGSDRSRLIAEHCERLYSKIMSDTALYSFLPKEPYRVTIYGGRGEFLDKTKMPDWSGGLSIGSRIYAFEGRELPGTLAHEMTHLIFGEYLGRDDLSLRWVNEGLAVYEEQEALAAAGFATDTGPARVLSFQEMLLLAPIGEDRRDVSAWYRQVGSVVRFMIERGGRVGFGQFMRALKDGQRTDDAVRTGFPGVWNGLDDLERAWRGGR
jgi:hypothetical protein